MFIGEYIHSLDDKGRIVLPQKLRFSLGEKFYVTRGLGGCIWILPEAEWSAFNQKLRERSLTDLNALRVQRFFAAGTFEVTTDSQFRLAIPATLREFAQIEGQAVIVGASNHVEMWNTERWNEINRDLAAEDVAAAAQAIGLNGTPDAPAF